MKLTETGFYDTRGIPICVGDLIRVKHFRHYKRREQIWLYFRVASLEGRFVVYCWGNFETHQCLLKSCGIDSAEVLDGESWINDRGELMMWNERPRVKPEVGRLAGYGTSPGQLGSMKPGTVDAVIGSPPFCGIVSQTDRLLESGSIPTANGGDNQGGTLRQTGRCGDYGTTPGQLGQMKPGNIDDAIGDA